MSLDERRTAALIARHYPGAVVWRGDHTGLWWAMVPALPDPLALIDAPDSGALVHEIGRRLWRLRATVPPPRRSTAPTAPTASAPAAFASPR